MNTATAVKEVWTVSFTGEDWTVLVTYPCSCGENHTHSIGVGFKAKDSVYHTFRRHPKFACGVKTNVLLTQMPVGLRKISLRLAAIGDQIMLLKILPLLRKFRTRTAHRSPEIVCCGVCGVEAPHSRC